MPKGETPGALEELLMLAVIKAEDDAYGLNLQRLLRGAGTSLQLPTIYTTLERLERKGWVSSRLGGANASRGGRAKRIFKIEAAGKGALRDGDARRQRLRVLTPGVDDVS
jgi:PadR family transcriptional regulator PadR